MSDDPTMQLIRDLDDPTKFVKKSRVAVFKPHTRTAMGQDGKPIQIKVDGKDLEEIARNVNAAYGADGQLVKLTIGHRKQDVNAPETAQPPIAGYARHYRAEMVERPDGPRLRLTHVEYIRADRKDILEEGRYPERSPEYDPVNKTITGVALLTRDQWLNLGTVSYSASGRVTYAMGAEMDDDKYTPEEEQQYARMCNYMKGKYPKLAQYMDDMGAMNGTLPVSVGSNEEPKPAMYASLKGNVDYAAIDARIKAVEAQHQASQKALITSESSRLLDKVKDIVKFDYQRELTVLVSLPDDTQRQAHVTYMLDNYQQMPNAYRGFIPVADAPPINAAGDPTVQYQNRDAVQAYIRKHPGISYDAAVAAVNSSKN